MPINAQIPLNAGKVPQVDVGQDWSRGANLAHTSLENQLLGSQRAAGQDWQKSVVNGQLNPSLYENNLAHDPRAAMSAQHATAQALANIHQQLANRGISLEQAFQQTSRAADTLGGLLASKKNLTQKDVIDAVSGEVSEGVMTAKTGAAFINEAAAIPPDQLDNWVRSKYSLAQHSANVVQQMIHLVNTGSSVQPYNTNPLASGGVGETGKPIPVTLSPAQKATPVTYTGAGGTQTSTTPAVIARNGYQLPGSTPVRNALTKGGIHTSGIPNIQTGQGTPIGPPGTVVGLSPAEQAAAQTTGVESAKSFSDLGNRVQSYGRSEGLISDMLSNIPTANMGPAAETVTSILALAREFRLPWGNSATATQLVNKNAMQLVSAQTEQLGMHADASMQKVIEGNPNARLTANAAYGAAAMLKANLEAGRFMQEQAVQWQNTHGKGTYQQFISNWNKNYGELPSAITFQYLPGEQKLEYYKMLKKEGRADKFLKDYNRFINEGLIAHPSEGAR